MQLTINRPSLTFSTTLLKPFLLVGVAAISSAALYSPLSSQSQNLKDKVNNDALKPIIPYTEKRITGSKKLFETLGNWAKYSANKTGSIKEWIKSLENARVERGAKEIYVTLEEWARKVYDFLKQFFTKEAWDRFKENVKKLGQFLNLFKNLMKLEFGGKASIFDKVIGNSKLMEAMGGLAEKHPEILGDLNEEDVQDIADALRADPDKVSKVMDELAKKEEGELSKDDLKNALKESTLIGKIQRAIEEANEIHKKGDQLSEKDKERGKEVLKNLETLHNEVKVIIEKANAAKAAPKKK